MVIDYSRDERALTIYSELNRNCEDFGLGSEKNLDNILKKSLLNFPKWKKNMIIFSSMYTKLMIIQVIVIRRIVEKPFCFEKTHGKGTLIVLSLIPFSPFGLFNAVETELKSTWIDYQFNWMILPFCGGRSQMNLPKGTF